MASRAERIGVVVTRRTMSVMFLLSLRSHNMTNNESTRLVTIPQLRREKESW